MAFYESSKYTPQSVGSITLSEDSIIFDEDSSPEVITANATGALTLSVSDNSICSAVINGNEITVTKGNALGIATITVVSTSNPHYAAASATITVENVTTLFGAEWDGTASSAWSRTDSAASFTEPQPYYSGMTGDPSSPFDNIMPWAGMEIVDDTEGGKLVKIPKFWYKWTRDGAKMKLQISNKERTGFYVSPAHAARAGSSVPRDYVYVGRYHCGVNSNISTSGVKPNTGNTINNLRTSIHNKGTKIWMLDYAMWWTVNMLYLVEYADWNSQAKIGGGCQTAELYDKHNSGATDNMPYHTGTVASSIAANVYGPMQYRYIEDWWGNVYDFIDGIRYNNKDVYVNTNPSTYNTTSGGTLVATTDNGSGVITEWTDNPASDSLNFAIVPKTYTYVQGGDSDTDNTYICDRYSKLNEYPAVYFGGAYNDPHLYCGAFALKCLQTSTSPNAVGARLQKLP